MYSAQGHCWGMERIPYREGLEPVGLLPSSEIESCWAAVVPFEPKSAHLLLQDISRISAE